MGESSKNITITMPSNDAGIKWNIPQTILEEGDSDAEFHGRELYDLAWVLCHASVNYGDPVTIYRQGNSTTYKTVYHLK
jgi:hypothetical protein